MDAFEQRWGRQGQSPEAAAEQRAAYLARLEEIGSQPPQPLKPEPTDEELQAKWERQQAARKREVEAAKAAQVKAPEATL